MEEVGFSSAQSGVEMFLQSTAPRTRSDGESGGLAIIIRCNDGMHLATSWLVPQSCRRKRYSPMILRLQVRLVPVSGQHYYDTLYLIGDLLTPAVTRAESTPVRVLCYPSRNRSKVAYVESEKRRILYDGRDRNQQSDPSEPHSLRVESAGIARRAYLSPVARTLLSQSVLA